MQTIIKTIYREINLHADIIITCPRAAVCASLERHTRSAQSSQLHMLLKKKDRYHLTFVRVNVINRDSACRVFTRRM